jgi:hypothetical protein
VLADGTHEYLAGMLTTYEFERRLHATDLPVFGAPRPDDDPVLSPMVQRLWLSCYVHGDLDEYRLTNEHKLPTESRREVLRWILFLRSDRQYEWPQFQCLADLNRNAGLIHPLLSLLTLGYWGRVQRETFRREAEQFMLAGDHDVWPFKRREDFQAVLAESCPLCPQP